MKMKKPYNLTQAHAGLRDKSNNIGRFCHGNMRSVPFEIAIREFKKEEINIKSKSPRCKKKKKKRESGSFSTAEIRRTMLSAPSMNGSGVSPLMVLTGARVSFCGINSEPAFMGRMNDEGCR